MADRAALSAEETAELVLWLREQVEAEGKRESHYRGGSQMASTAFYQGMGDAYKLVLHHLGEPMGDGA